MDGYAVRSGDVPGASQTNAKSLKLVGEIPAGGDPELPEINGGECVRVYTGSRLPKGADAVVMQEDARHADADHVEFTDSVKPWEHIRFQGEDIRKGTVLARTGESISVGHIAALAATGSARIAVSKRPRVALLATGDELVEPGSALAPGQIYESNRVLLAELVRAAGGQASVLPLVPDSLAATRDAFVSAWESHDVVLTTGGVSVGDYDFVRPALEEAGGVLDFWRVAVRPGKPFVHGRMDACHHFGLPGNPVSALVTFLLLVRPALLRMQGAQCVDLPIRRGMLTEDVANSGNRRHFMRVSIDERSRVRLGGAQASHAVKPLAETNGLLDVASNKTLKAGTEIEVLIWKS
jgi:molybdopterin molybdotransferase